MALPFTVQPVIHERLGTMYEIVCSIPAGKGRAIHYFGGDHQEVNGPNAMVVLPDDSFLIADSVGDRLVRFDQKGRLMNSIKMDKLGIGYVADMRLKGNELFLLEISYEKYRVHRLTLEGALISSEPIPHRFPIGDGHTLENGLTGIAVDCEENILLDIEGGSRLSRLADVQQQSDPSKVSMGYSCNGKRYWVTYLALKPGSDKSPRVFAGDGVYSTHSTIGLGGLSFLDVFQDGAFYLVRDDVVNSSPIEVDQTVHYFGSDGTVQGVARVPLAEFYYHPVSSLAISTKGEVFVMLTRLETVDIVHLNFYKQLEPLIPGAVIPEIFKVKKPEKMDDQ
jgi:hypothetical protein